MNLVSGFLWSNAGFSSLRNIKELEHYEPRYDPTVIPVADPAAPASDSYPHFSPVQDPPQNLPRKYLSVTDYHALYRSGKLTPINSVEALLPLIRRDTSPPGAHSVAFLSTEVELVRRAAQASTLRYQQGKPLGVLDGVPIAVKDEVDLDGYRKTLGSARDYTREGGGTSWCVKKWEEQGAIILGKLNMHELGMGRRHHFLWIRQVMASSPSTVSSSLWFSVHEALSDPSSVRSSNPIPCFHSPIVYYPPVCL